ncbi:Serine/threonine-protein phosphatase PP1-gamma catalytic subunit [Taenia solium]|eukprot:TsM_000179700 transcript=TsM_000179700 gene=TsM_000179700
MVQDDGQKEMQTLATLLLAYKLKYPHNIYLLRSYHECERMCKNNGFERELIERYNDHRVLDYFIDAFNYMPIGAIIEQSVSFTHGGIPKDLVQPYVADLRAGISRINRPVDVPTDGLTHDLLWSDPISEGDPTPLGWQPTRRRVFRFGHDVSPEFLHKYQMGNIILAHQYLQNGFHVFHGRRFSIFLAPNCKNRYGNEGPIAIVEDRNENIMHILTHLKRLT